MGSVAVNQCIVPLKIVNGKFVAKSPEFVCVPGFKPPA